MQSLLVLADQQNLFVNPSEEVVKNYRYVKEAESTVSSFISISNNSSTRAKHDLGKQDSLDARLVERKSNQLHKVKKSAN